MASKRTSTSAPSPTQAYIARGSIIGNVPLDLEALFKEYERVRPEQKTRLWQREIFCLVLHSHVSNAYQEAVSQALNRKALYTESLALVGLTVVDYCISHGIDLQTGLLTGQERQKVPGRFEDGLLGLHDRIQTVRVADTETAGLVDLFAYLIMFTGVLNLDIGKAMLESLARDPVPVVRKDDK